MILKPVASFDTSFWAHASHAGLLPGMLRRYALRYTAAVANELPERYASGREFWRLVRAGELEEVNPQRDTVRRFGPGERATISVGLEHRDWLLLVDDVRAFEWAAARGLRLRCTPLMIVDFFLDGDLDAAEAFGLLDGLAVLRTLSPRLIALARGLVMADTGGILDDDQR